MVIGGLQKLSLSDFPGVLSAILFTQGCSFRCPYCHNPELVDPSRFRAAMPMDEIWEFLGTRAGRIEGVVVTGGEPTIHSDLPDLLAGIRSLGYLAKLDTNGSNPEMLREIVLARLADYIAMDLKAPMHAYQKVAGAPVRASALQESIAIIISSGLPHEFRTTFVPSLLTADDLLAIGDMIRGCRKYVLQAFRGTTTLTPELKGRPSPHRSDLEALKATLCARGFVVEVR